MQYRCSDCGELFESHHTNYKHAKGFHPNDNPTHSAEVAKQNDHCLTCQASRTYDPVEARKRDLVAATGMDTGLIGQFQQQIASLTAQVEAAKQEHAVALSMKDQISNLEKTLAGLKPVTA